MIPSKIENIIIKYINRSATLNDFKILNQWIKKESNKQYFKDYVQTHYAINFNLIKLDTTETMDQLLHEIRKNKSIFYKYRFISKLKYAAILVLFLGLCYLFQNGYFTSASTLIIPENSITLELENGNIQIIAEDGQTRIMDSKGNIVGTQSGNQINYNNGVKKEKLVYNTLTVPYGKRFEIELSDGTHVHLNAGTSLKYPVKFIEGENRQVFIVEGEANFTVAQDKKHPFIVNTNAISIRVLGTQFNVSSYSEDEYIHTVLVEGAVSIYNKDESYNPDNATILTPGFQASWDKISNQTTVKEADIEMHTAWMKGRLILDEVAFNDILKKLERQYNVSFINNYKILNNRYFTARFDIENIHQVMQSLSELASFSYVFKENLIIINP